MAEPATAQRDLAAYALRLADDALVRAQRLCEWVTRAPTVEEDLALSNIALDLIGQARTLYTCAGRHDGTGRDEDDLAYGREAAEFRNTLLAEQPGGDFGRTIARQLVCTHHSLLLHTVLRDSPDPELSGFAARAVHETEYHLMHATRWAVQLGRGTAESRRRLRAGLDDLWPYTGELFESDDLTRRLAADAVIAPPDSLREPWRAAMTATLEEAGLPLPHAPVQRTGGRRGEHTPHLPPLLAQLREVRRAYPGGTW